MPDENPYQSPVSVGTSGDPPLSSAENRKRVQAALGLPALILVVLCQVAIVLHSVIIVQGAFRAPYVLDDLLLAFINLFTLCGAISMCRLRSLWFARTAMGLACIPCLSPLVCVGIPFGLWGLVVLSRPHVAAEFR